MSRIKEKKINSEEREKYNCQKLFFQYMNDKYSNLLFNNIEYKLIKDFNIKKISYTIQNFNAYKKKKLRNMNINENKEKF